MNRYFCVFLTFVCSVLFGCRPSESGDDINSTAQAGKSPDCSAVTVAATPVAANVFVPGSYAGRSFLSPANHLGEDVAMPEGSPVVAMASGIITFFGSASGYGELLVAIEHHLPKAITVKNGNQTSTTTSVFLSLYGHLRASASQDGEALPLKAGDCVAAGQVIGYVNDDAHNGDGKEHVHVGVRLMSDAAAHAKDGSKAYRGYDTPAGSFKGDFAAAHNLLATLSASPTWHPDGSLIKVVDKPEIYRLEWGQRRYIPSEKDFQNAHLYTAGAGSIWNRVIDVTEAELSCFQPGTDDVSPKATVLAECQDGRFLAPGNEQQRVKITTLSGTKEDTELLRSWGMSANDTISGGSVCNRPVAYTELLLRDGTLVKEEGKSDVYVVADAIAWPIDSWDTFLSFGFKQANIQTLPVKTLSKHVLGVSGFLLDASYKNRCLISIAGSCSDAICLASLGGGGEIQEQLDENPEDPPDDNPPCVPETETCDGTDNDCDGVVDNGCEEKQPDAGAGDPPKSGHTVRVLYPATTCLNNDIGGGWAKVCENQEFDHTWQGVTAGLKRMNYPVSGTWLCSEPSPGDAMAPLGLPQVWVDDVLATAFVIHDWTLSWGCNVMLCVGGACELCCDGQDNDGDGKTDLQDPDCINAVACLP